MERSVDAVECISGPNSGNSFGTSTGIPVLKSIQGEHFLAEKPSILEPESIPRISAPPSVYRVPVCHTVCWWERCQIRCIRHLFTVFSSILTSTGLSARMQMQGPCVNRRMCVSLCAHECVFTKCLLNSHNRIDPDVAHMLRLSYVRNAYVSHEHLRAQPVRRPLTGWVLPISGERHVCAPLITCSPLNPVGHFTLPNSPGLELTTGQRAF